MWRLFHSLRGRLIALVLVGAVPGLAAILYTGVEQRRQAAAAVHGEAMRVAQLAAGAHKELFAETRRLVRLLAQLPAVREGSAAACSALLTQLHKQDPAPRYSSFFTLRPNGDVFCSSAPVKGRINASDQAYYRRVMATRAFAIGDYQIGRITGRAIVILSEPVLDAAGAVQAVVGAGIDLTWLNRLAAETQLPAGSMFTLVDHAGTVLVRAPDNEKWIGRSMAGTPLLAAMHAQHDGVLETAGLDGVTRLYAYTAIYEPRQEGHAYLSVGIPKAMAFVEADHVLLRNLVTFALVVLLMLAAAWAGSHAFVLRQVNALLGAVQRLRAGDLGARAGHSGGVSEIGRLAQAFDQMAAALQVRQAEVERAAAKFTNIVNLAADAIISVNDAQRIVVFNRGAEQIFGYSAAEILGQPLDRLLPERFVEAHRRHIGGFAAAPDASRDMNGRPAIHGRRKDGSEFPAEANISKTVENGGLLFTVFLRDVSARQQAEKELRRLNRVYAMLSRINSAIIRLRERSELLHEACRIAVEEGRFRLAWIGQIEPGSRTLAPAQWYGGETDALRSLRLPLDATAPGGAEPIGARLLAGHTLVCNDIARAPAAEREVARACGAHACALLPLHAAGNVVGAFNLYAAEPDFFDAEEMKLLGELVADISLGLESIEKGTQLQYLAYHDVLTGLPNRALFLDRLGQALARAAYHDRHVAALTLYVERLKEINSLHGHHTGDALLRAVAQQLQGLVRPGDTVARFGSASFGVLLADVAGTDDVTVVAEKILAALQRAVVLHGHELFVTVRADIAVAPEDGEEAEVLIRHAEAAAHLPPTEAGGALHFYMAEIDRQAAERLELEKALRHALERRELALHYQPVVDLQTLEVVGAEALMRWQHPALGAMSPARFIPVAEETGLIVPLGEWALETALAQSRHWQARGLSVTVAVNLSVKQLQQPDFAERLAGRLEAAGPFRLALEVTESLLMKAPERYVALLDALRTRGVTIYIDDFGTGYSSLAYLKRLPVDALKIDISFVRDIARDPEDAAIVKAIVALAHSLEMKAIAEGVETAEQFSTLRALGVDAAQGFLFSPAVPAEAFEALLDSGKPLLGNGPNGS